MEQLTLKNIRSSILGSFKIIFYEYPLANLNRGWENPYQVYSELYRTEDDHLLEEFLENMDHGERFAVIFTMEEVNQRIKDGHIFYVAKKNEKIIGYCWYLVNNFKIPEFDTTFYLNPDEVCSANSYIQPESRGKGIRNYMRAYEYNDLMQKGYKRSVTYVFEDNKASLRMHQKWGSIQIGVVKRINILTFAYHYTNITSNKINFHSGPFLLWKKLYHIIKISEFKNWSK